MAVFAVLAVSPAVADNVTIDSNKTYSNGLTMSGSDSNKIVGQDKSVLFGAYTLPGYIVAGSNANVTANSGDIEMSTEGYNAVVGSVTGDFWALVISGKAQPTVTAKNGNVIMDGPANAVMLGSTVKGTNITLENTGDKTITVGKVTDGILGDFAAPFIPSSMKGMEGIFNIVQGSKLEATESVTLNTATDTAVNKLKVNVIAGGRGDITDVVSEFLADELGNNVSKFAGTILNAITQDNVGSTIKAGKDINMGGGASVIVDTTLSDLVDFAEADDTMEGLQSLLAGNSSNKTKVELTAGNNLNLNSIINMSYAAQGGVALSAGADINATGALNIVGGKTTMAAENINFTPGTSVSFNQLAGELGQLGGMLPIDLSGVAGQLGSLANEKINASVVAGGAQLTADQDINMSGTAGVLVNAQVTDMVGALGLLKDGHELLFAQSILNSGTGTTVTATNGNINLGSKLNVLHGGKLGDDNAALVLNATHLTRNENGEAITGVVNIEGTANVVSGNVVVKAGEINMMGEVLGEGLIDSVGGFASDLVGKIPGGSTIASTGIVDSLLGKGSFNVVTGGATLETTGGNIKLSSGVDATFGQVGAINAVLDTELTDLITVVRHGELSAIMPKADGSVDTVTTTLKSNGGDINLEGRVNIVNGLRGGVVLDATKVDENGEIVAMGDVNLQGNISMVSGNSTVNAENININTVEDDKFKMHLNADELTGILPIPENIAGAVADMGMVNATIVAGGANLTADQNITTGGTVGLLMNTPVADAIKEFNPLSPTKNPSELEIVGSLLQKGEATTLTSTNGNINVGSQFNLLHGGNMGDADAALVLKAENLTYNEAGEAITGIVNIEGTANVVSGNVLVQAGDINMTGEVLPNGMATAANGLVSSLTEGIGIPAVSGVLGKLVNKGSVNMVTGGATLDAAGDITMNGKSEDDVGKIGNINAVIDTQMVDVLNAYLTGKTDSLEQGGGYTTKLEADGNIDLLGRVNLVNGSYVELKAGNEVNMQGNLSVIGGSTVKGNSININTVDDEKYKMFIDSSDLGVDLPIDAETAAKLGNTGINAAIVAGGAKLEAKEDITLGGTVGLVVNTPAAGVMDELMSYTTHEQETWLAYQVLQQGIATSVKSTEGNINLGSDFNLIHGGNFSANPKKPTALVIDAAQAVNVHGTANVVSGNVTVEGNTINLTGERLTGDMAGVAGSLAGSVVGSIAGDVPAVDGMVDKLVSKGSLNVVTGGATLTADNGITMNSVPDKGVINAVLDTELIDPIEAFMERDLSALMEGGSKQTTLTATNGNIELLGSLNLVHGGKVALKAENGTVKLNGALSMISGGATVNAKNITINGDDSGKYQTYFDSAELGAVLPADSPITQVLDGMGITDLLGSTGVNAGIVTGGTELTASGNISTGGTVGILVNAPVSGMLKEFESYTKHEQETWLAYQLLQKGVATTVTSTDGNINLASRLNVVHGGNIANASEALQISAENGTVKMSGSANLVSGNVIVDANDITMKGAPLGFDTGDALDGVPGGVILDKLAAQGSGNMVTGGATLTATNNLQLNSMANVVLDTELIDPIEAFMERDLAPLMTGGSKQTTLTAENGDIELLGSLNLVNGGKVVLEAENGTVKLDGALSMISGGATVTAENIKINADEDCKYQAYVDSAVLGSVLPADSPITEALGELGITDLLGSTGVNAGIVAGGADLTATGDITTGGTVGILVNTPVSEMMKEFESYTKHEQETWLAYQLLQKGVATKVTSTDGNINLASRLNVLHGGNITDASEALQLSAEKGAVKMNGSANLVSGNVTVDANDIIMKGEPLKFDTGDALDGMPGGVILDKLAARGSANMVTGGATLTATNNIQLNSMANFVLDTELVDPIEAFMERDLAPLMTGGSKTTTLTAENGDIELLGKLNLVNGGKVELKAENGTVNLNGALSMISGGATVTAENIKINDDESGKYQTYFDSAELDAILPAGSPITEALGELGITDLLGSTGVNAGIVAGGADLTASGDITTGGTVGILVNTPVSEMMKEFISFTEHGQETWLAYQLLQKGVATTVTSTKGDINLASRLNVVHGGNIEDASEALQLSAENGAVKMSGSANLVSGNVTVDANDIIMKGEPLKYDAGDAFEGMEEAELLNKLAAEGSANIVAGGATLTATDSIQMEGMANFVVGTELTDVVEAFMERDFDSLGQGATQTTKLTAETGDVSITGNMNVLLNADVVAKGGNVSINGGSGLDNNSIINNSVLTAEQGQVTFADTVVTGSGSSASAATGMTLANATVMLDDVTLFGGETTIAADSLLAVTDSFVSFGGEIENMGTLSLNDVALSGGSDLVNGGVIEIDGDLSLDSAKLTFVVNSLTDNETAITLGGEANILDGGSVDVTFVIEGDKVASALYNYQEFSFVLFENASDEDFINLRDALAGNDVSFTLNNSDWNAYTNGVELKHEGGNIVITGSVMVPEPTTATLSLLALAALAARRRRK